MAELKQNFVIHDVVQHVYERDYYSERGSFRQTIRQMIRNSRMYIVIVLISCGVGYLAVYLPDKMQSASPLQSGLGFSPEQIKSMAAQAGSMSDEEKGQLRSKFDGLSEDQKKVIMEQFGGR